jgi:hypothetical protein
MLQLDGNNISYNQNRIDQAWVPRPLAVWLQEPDLFQPFQRHDDVVHPCFLMDLSKPPCEEVPMILIVAGRCSDKVHPR